MPRGMHPRSQANLKRSQKPPEDRGVWPGQVAAGMKARLIAEARQRGLTSRQLLELLIVDACPPQPDPMTKT